MIVNSSYVALLLSLVLSASLVPQTKADGIENEPTSPARAAILSPTHPKDSHDEVVYEVQGDSQKNIPTVQGVFIAPSAIKIPNPKYPKSLKRHLADETVTVLGVVAKNGDFIDAIVIESVDPDVRKSALDAASRAKFHPATLDGKSIAVLVQFKIQFKIY